MVSGKGLGGGSWPCPGAEPSTGTLQNTPQAFGQVQSNCSVIAGNAAGLLSWVSGVLCLSSVALQRLRAAGVAVECSDKTLSASISSPSAEEKLKQGQKGTDGEAAGESVKGEFAELSVLLS